MDVNAAAPDVSELLFNLVFAICGVLLALSVFEARQLPRSSSVLNIRVRFRIATSHRALGVRLRTSMFTVRCDEDCPVNAGEIPQRLAGEKVQH
jgi:hypothetical protein